MKFWHLILLIMLDNFFSKYKNQRRIQVGSDKIGERR